MRPIYLPAVPFVVALLATAAIPYTTTPQQVEWVAWIGRHAIEITCAMVVFVVGYSIGKVQGRGAVNLKD